MERGKEREREVRREKRVWRKDGKEKKRKNGNERRKKEKKMR